MNPSWWYARAAGMGARVGPAAASGSRVHSPWLRSRSPASAAVVAGLYPVRSALAIAALVSQVTCRTPSGLRPSSIPSRAR